MQSVISPRAQKDIDDIWDYTVERWGEQQADAYVRLLEAAIAAVAADPTIGQACDDVRPGYRMRFVGSHILFYRTTMTALIVVRILHQRMDVERHL